MPLRADRFDAAVTVSAVGDGLLASRFRALGTACQLQAPAGAGPEGWFAGAVSWLAQFEARWSRFQPGSLLSQINARAGSGNWTELSPEDERLFDLAGGIVALTGGLLDPATLPLTRFWQERAGAAEFPGDAEVAAVRRRCGWARVERRPGAVRLPAGAGLDFGGFGKEYAADALADLARAAGLDDFLVELGGDLVAGGRPPGQPYWHIGVEDPARPGQGMAGLRLSGEAVATSGGYARHVTVGGRRLGHILDPRSGWPAHGALEAVTVVAPTCLEAGILSTCAFLLGEKEAPGWLAQFPGAAARFHAPPQVFHTPLFPRYYVRAA